MNLAVRSQKSLKILQNFDMAPPICGNCLKFSSGAHVFSGIIEAKACVLEACETGSGVRIKVEKPSFFNDLSVGDSIAVNGVCLTVEEFTDSDVWFTLAAETLQVTGWKAQELLGRQMNLERSLQFGARVHGHLVTGHVDQVTEVVAKEELNGSVVFWIEIPEELKRWIWKKGCVCLNGVSLTVNEVLQNRLSVCLIPETLRQTNLSELNSGDKINIECDYLAKALIHGNQEL